MNQARVIIITYNRRVELLHTLEQLTALSEKPPITVVDNGSSDGTVEAVCSNFPSVHVIPLRKNFGSYARTIGVKESSEPYLAFCDDDIWWKSGSIARGCEVLNRYSKVAIVVARVLVGPEKREDPICAVLEASPLPRPIDLPGPPLIGFLAGASIVRRSAFLAVGGYHPAVGIGGEEELLSIDLVSNGWFICYLPELEGHHYPSQIRNTYRRRVNILKNQLLYTWLRRPLPAALRKSAVLLSSSGFSKIAFYGLTSALAGLPSMIRERKVVPSFVEEQLRLLEK
jgi:GT2 family glycosyltransferase